MMETPSGRRTVPVITYPPPGAAGGTDTQPRPPGVPAAAAAALNAAVSSLWPLPSAPVYDEGLH